MWSQCKFVNERRRSMVEDSDMFIKECEGRILDVVDRRAFAEVGECFRLGLYKAGYILCWTVLAESLRGKIKQLSDMGYNPAINENTRIDKLERSHRSADVQIIDSAKTCELISDTEHTICKQLWTKRCLFAHPYGTQATEIDCRDIIEKTLIYSMARPIYLTKSMIDERLDDYIAHPHTVPDEAKVAMEISSFLKLILPKNHVTLFQALFYRIRLRLEAGKNWDVFRFLLRMCRTHIVDNHLDLNEGRYRIDKGIADYPDTTWVVVSDSRIWVTLTDVRRENLVKYLATANAPRMVMYGVRNLLKAGVNYPANITDVYYSKAKGLNINFYLKLYLDLDRMLDDIWDKYVSGHQFSEQGSFINFLEDNADAMSRFDSEQLARLGDLVGYCCCTGTFKARNFVRDHDCGWFDSPAFVSGVVMGCMKSADGQRLIFAAWSQGLRALRHLMEIDETLAKNVIADLKNTPVNTGDFQYMYNKDELISSVNEILRGDAYTRECADLLEILG